jgi:serpin B
MTTLDRRTLIARSAAAAALAAIHHRATLAASAQPSPEAVPDPLIDLVDGNTAFALDLYHHLRQSASGNMLFSPLSISLALAMTYAGAEGDTAAQMATTLGLTLTEPLLHATLAGLTNDLIERGAQERDDEAGRGEGGLRIANALWGEQSFPFDPAFTTTLDDHYGAGLELVDFIDAPDAAREDINAWVAEHTEDRITDIVPEGAITDLTRLVLANAIWFYGAWRHTFDESSTRDEPFHLATGDTIDVPFMVQVESFAYGALDTFQAVELAYDNGGFAMTILLPEEGQLDAVEAALDPDALQAALVALERKDIHLFLPKFGFEFDASLVEPLQALGMPDAFDPGRADFTGMVDGPLPPGENLSIGDVLHKAFIAVDEEGTEAAAATVVIMETTAAQPDEQEPLEVRIDRPFLFTIRDTRTGTILFLGRVTDPRG